MDRLRRIARDISPALSGFEPHCEPGLLELLGGGIHDGEIHAADPVRCRRGPARRRLGGRVGWPVDAIVIEAGAFGGVPATGAGVPVDWLPGHGCKRGPSACRHCAGPATASNRGTRLAWPRVSQDSAALT